MILGIYGAGGQGREVLELAGIINRQKKRWEDFIFIIDNPGGFPVNNIMVYNYKDAVKKFDGNLEISMGVGEPATRERLFEKIKRDGIPAATLVHPDVFLPETAKIGNGVTIQYGCFISSNVTIEDYVYIQPQANIAHDVVLREGSVVSGMANLAGQVELGRYSFVGLSAAIRECIKIGAYAVVGMYSAVHKNVPDEVIVTGNPATILRENSEHIIFRLADRGSDEDK